MSIGNDNFFYWYNLLPFKYQQIIYEMMTCMNHCSYSQKLSSKTIDIRGNIKFAQKKRKLKDEEVCEQVSSLSGLKLSVDEYRHIRNKNVQSSSYLKWIAEVLGTTEEELKQGFSKEFYNNITIMSNDATSIKWLYKSLDIKDKNAILTLAISLFKLEFAPEVFDNID